MDDQGHIERRLRDMDPHGMPNGWDDIEGASVAVIVLRDPRRLRWWEWIETRLLRLPDPRVELFPIRFVNPSG